MGKKKWTNISEHLTPKTVPIKHKTLKLVAWTHSMYYLPHSIFTIINVHFTNENTKTKNVWCFCKILISPTKKNEDQTGNIHDYLL